jgi:WD40 repeat protein
VLERTVELPVAGEGHVPALSPDSIKHSGNLSWIEWGPDSRRMLTAGYNDAIVVWDATTGAQLLAPVRTPGGVVRVARWSPDGRFILTRDDARRVRVWDGETGDAVTPLLEHAGPVGFVFMTATQRLITASEPNLIRAWDLRQTDLSAGILSDYAVFLSGRRLDPNGLVLPLKPTELAELGGSLRARAPRLMSVP